MRFYKYFKEICCIFAIYIVLCNQLESEAAYENRRTYKTKKIRVRLYS